MDVIDDDENLQCEDCRFAPDLIPMDNGNKYLCIVCGRIYDTELGDIAKHHMQLRSEVDDVMIAESSEPMIVNFADQCFIITKRPFVYSKNMNLAERLFFSICFDIE